MDQPFPHSMFRQTFLCSQQGAITQIRHKIQLNFEFLQIVIFKHYFSVLLTQFISFLHIFFV